MSTLKENLIAARALIDTPITYHETGATRALDRISPPGSPDNKELYEALREAGGPKWKSRYWKNHKQVMFRFDRAIEAAS